MGRPPPQNIRAGSEKHPNMLSDLEGPGWAVRIPIPSWTSQSSQRGECLGLRTVTSSQEREDPGLGTYQVEDPE